MEKEELVEELRRAPTEEGLWQVLLACQNEKFFTASGLPFSYRMKIGRNGQYNRELLIDRRESSKTLTWGSIRLAFQNALGIRGTVVPKPKALGDIRGISYVYPLLWRFGLIEVPEKTAAKMGGERDLCE